MELDQTYTEADVKVIRRFIVTLHAEGRKVGFDEGYAAAKEQISFARRAYTYSGHFVLGMVVGGLGGMFGLSIFLKSMGLLTL